MNRSLKFPYATITFEQEAVNSALGYPYYTGTHRYQCDRLPFIPMVAPPATRTNPEPSCPVSYHGSDRFVQGATPKERNWRYLPKHLQHIGELLSYGITEGSNGTDAYYLIEDYSGPGISDRDRDYEVMYESPVNEWETLDRWTDKDPAVTTHAIEWWTNDRVKHTYATPKDVTSNGPYGSDTNYIGDEARNAYIEGADGFTSRKLLDEELTRKYHARLLNVYLDKQQSIAIGSIRIRSNGDGTIYAECVAGYCNLTSPPINPDTVTREQMEDFILGIVRHGNNHAAKWFRDRETYYKVHATGCDLHCDPNSAGCNNNVVRPSVLTDEDVIQFLFDHQTYCKDTKCKCDERLAELVPVLTKEYAA